MTQLYWLDLSKSQLSSLHPKMFSGLAEVQSLSLHENNLSGELNPELFKDMTGLKYLFLQNNTLTSFHEDTFRSQAKLVYIYISGNSKSLIEQNLVASMFPGLRPTCTFSLY
jgi:Leucine-rich repeat (LRR) protein